MYVSLVRALLRVFLTACGRTKPAATRVDGTPGYTLAMKAAEAAALKRIFASAGDGAAVAKDAGGSAAA